MSFFRKVNMDSGSESVQPRAETVPAAALHHEDEALDTLINIIRTFGAHAFDVDTKGIRHFQESNELWARHLATGSPPPEGASRGHRRSERDWRGVRHFVRQRREREHKYVTDQVGNVRELVWEVVEGLREMSSTATSAQASVDGCLERLQHAAAGDSLAELRRAVAEVVGAVKQTVAEQQKLAEQELQRMGARMAVLHEDLSFARRQMELDSLTQLYNRGAFDSLLEKYVRLHQMMSRPLALLMVDVDHFKSINDSFGHVVGDQVLTKCADTMVKTFPRKHDIVARYGGEEFAIILLDVEACDLSSVSQRMLKAIRKVEVEEVEEPLLVTCSVGAAALKLDDTPDLLLRRADSALYRAKEAGRDRFELGEA